MELQRRRRLWIIACTLGILSFIAWASIFLQRQHHLVGGGINRVLLFLIINIHILALGILLFLIIRQSVKLFIERKKGHPGSVFKRNLLFAFTLFSIIPSFFIFFTASKFITRHINEWFHARIEQGLLAGLRLHEIETLSIREKLSNTGGRILRVLEEENISALQFIDLVHHMQILHDHLRLYIWPYQYPQPHYGTIQDEVRIWRTFRMHNDRTMQSIQDAFLKKIKAINKPSIIDFYGSLYWVATYQNYWIIIVKRYDPQVRCALIDIQNSITDYQQLKSIKNPIYIHYFFTFFLIMLLILLLSIWCAFYLARGISKPIQELLDAIALIRQGKLPMARLESRSTDDLRILVEGFNEMVQAIQKAQRQLQEKHRELFMILENIKAAVFLINSYGRIVRHNGAAQKMAYDFAGVHVISDRRVNILGRDIMATFMRMIRNVNHQKISDCYTQELMLMLRGEERFFIVTISKIVVSNMPGKEAYGTLIALEDITDVVKANTLKTWQEAAKQMAHEIKNPLTPIQLATQRLQRRFAQHHVDDATFLQCTNIILEHVGLIKNLVMHFSEFATMPALVREQSCIKAIILQVCDLYRISYPHISITVKASKDIPLLLLDIKKIKRVFVNLFDNSIRVLEAQREKDVTFHGKIGITMSKDFELSVCRIIFFDNGPGFQDAIKDKLFYPYVSTEQKNMGLGLAIVKDIISMHNGSIEIVHKNPGAHFLIKLPLDVAGIK